jgi:putative component of membrane protein insertase Oxa1/YidC/SpoIIIJ protein YidD
MLRAGSIALIAFYQGYLSPLKGFSCAHRVLHGGASCSQAVKLAVAEGGLAAGWRTLKIRARDCRVAMIALQSGKQEGEGDADHQRPVRRKRRRGTGWLTGEDCCLLGVAEGCNVCFLSFFS